MKYTRFTYFILLLFLSLKIIINNITKYKRNTKEIQINVNYKPVDVTFN